MKISGVSPGLNQGTFDLTRGDRAFRLTLSALPIGWNSRNEREVPDPVPATEFAKDGKGRILRDADDRPVARQKTDDPAYRAARSRAEFLRGIHSVVEALREDKTVVLDAKRKKFPTTPAWLEAVVAELAADGITEAEIAGMLDKVRELNLGRGARVEAEASDFLPVAPSPQPGQSQTAPDATKGIS